MTFSHGDGEWCLSEYSVVELDLAWFMADPLFKRVMPMCTMAIDSMCSQNMLLLSHGHYSTDSTGLYELLLNMMISTHVGFVFVGMPDM